MAWSYVQSAKGVSNVLAFGSNVVAGNLLIGCKGSDSAAADSAPTDSQGNTWTPIQTILGGQRSSWWYTIAGSSAACTVTFDPDGNFLGFIVAEYDPPAGTVALEDNDGQFEALSPTTPDGVVTPAMTATSSDVLVVGFVQNASSGATFTPGTGFSEREENVAVPTQLEDKGAGAGSVTATWTIGSSSDCITLGAVFGVTGGAAQNQLAWVRA